jgi:hypothetical protein
MSPEQQNLSLYIAVANFALTWGVALYMYLSNKNKATNERIGKLEEDIDGKLDDHGGRIAHLEGLAERAPSHDDLSKLYAAQNETAGDVRQLIGQVGEMNTNLRLLLSRIAEKGMQ